MSNVLAPVTSSPCRMACWTGAAPRQAGRMEKCRLTQPRGGISSAACGSRAPYAVTGQQSGPIARSGSRNSGARARAGVSTSRPAAAARWATGLGSTLRPRPAGASGRVTTAATSCREVSSASSAVTAVSGVPAKTRRISEGLAPGLVRRDAHPRDRVAPPLGLADGLHRRLALAGVHPVDEQHAVQVVGLVLDAAGEQFGALDGHRVAVHVEPLGHHAPGPLDRVDQAGERQAALVVLVLVLRQVQRGIDQVTGLVVVDVVGEDPQADPDLRRGQACPVGIQHGFGEVFDQPAQLGVEITDRLGRRAQHGITEKTNRLDAHENPPGHRMAAACSRGAATVQSIRQATSAGSSWTRMTPPSLRALRVAWAACSARASASPSPRPILINALLASGGGSPPAPPCARGGCPPPRAPLAPSSTGTGPRTSAWAGSLVAVTKSAMAAGGPVMEAIRTAGGKPSSVRSASSCSANETGSQRMRAWTAGWDTSASTTTGPDGRTRAAAFSQRRSASSAARRLGRPSSAQPSSSSAAA